METITNHLVPTIEIPPSAIKGMVINNEARQLLSRHDADVLLSPDTIKGWTQCTIPEDAKQAPYNAFYSHPEEGRTLAVHTGQYWYGDNYLGTVVLGKGMNIAGMLYKNVVYGDGQAYTTSNPWGFFGDQGAAHDMAEMSTFVASGIRAALPLAFVYIDKNHIARIIERYWSGLGEQLMLQSLEKVTQEGDELVQSFRLGGVRPRIATTLVPAKERLQADPNLRGATRSSLALLKYELNTHPQRLHNFAELGNDRTPEECMNVLNNLIDLKQISEDDLFDFLTGMFGSTVIKIYELYQKNPIVAASYINQPNLTQWGAKDVDLVGTLYDKEHTDIPKLDDVSMKHDLATWASNIIIHYQDLLGHLGYTTGNYNYWSTYHRMQSILLH